MEKHIILVTEMFQIKIILINLFIYKVFFFFKLVTPDVSMHPSGERKDNSLQ